MTTYGIFVRNAKTETKKRAYPGTTFTSHKEAGKFAEYLTVKGKAYLMYFVGEVENGNSAAVALGSIKSERKAKSSAANGKLGGRPKKITE